ncbi:MAG TPA: F0F1 ATP synthase subunit gamma [Candidatus Omnitrophota bacterium]|nr:F0F1 ATP synthase subunit gamma [Candidatus Omnitrophota bacterium]
MGRSNKAKVELKDAIEMLFLIQTLKDIADNKYHTLINQKYKYRRFSETFVEFFRMLSLTKVEHPMISNNNPVVGVLVITIEGSFLGEFNNKIIRRGMEEYQKFEQAKFIGVGGRAVEKLKEYTPDLQVFSNMEAYGIYETAVVIKDYLYDEVMSGRLGKVIVCYAWPKSFEIEKPRAVKLLPCDELLSKQAQFVDQFEDVLLESDPKDIIGFLANLWITTRIYEILMDTLIASASYQARFLEDAVEKMKKEKNKAQLKYRKAKKTDIDTSLRETNTARQMVLEQKGSAY